MELNPRDIDLAFISDADIRSHRNQLGRLGFAMVREVRPIAGRWNPPTGLKEPTIDHRMFLQGIRASRDRFGHALASAFQILWTSAVGVEQGMAGGFVNKIVDAVEHLTKAMLVRNGHQPRRIHHLGDLADDVASLTIRN